MYPKSLNMNVLLTSKPQAMMSLQFSLASLRDSLMSKPLQQPPSHARHGPRHDSQRLFIHMYDIMFVTDDAAFAKHAMQSPRVYLLWLFFLLALQMSKDAWQIAHAVK